MKYTSWYYKIYHQIAQLVPMIELPNYAPLDIQERKEIKQMFAKGYYLILTANRYSLSSWMVKILTFAKYRKWPKYSHILMNVDFMDSPKDVDKFKFIEATSLGVHFSTFEDVMHCTDICLLTPKGLTNEDYTGIIDSLIGDNGKPYDDLFDLSDDSKMSCVELIRDALKDQPWYYEKFAHFESMIQQRKQLTPQMFYDCKDFEKVLEK